MGRREECVHILKRRNEDVAEGDDVLVLEMLEKLKLSVCAFGQDRGGEWLHDLLDGNILAGQLIFGGAVFQH